MIILYEYIRLAAIPSTPGPRSRCTAKIPCFLKTRSKSTKILIYSPVCHVKPLLPGATALASVPGSRAAAAGQHGVLAVQDDGRPMERAQQEQPAGLPGLQAHGAALLGAAAAGTSCICQGGSAADREGGCLKSLYDRGLSLWW